MSLIRSAFRSRYRVTASVFVLAIGLFFFSPAHVTADLLQWFSSDLNNARKRLADAEREFRALGPLVLRQSVPQIGGQLRMTTDPPPQAPWIQIDLGKVATFDRLMVVPAIVGVANDSLESYAFPKRFRIDISESENFSDFDLIYDSAADQLDASDPFPVVIESGNARSRYIRFTATELANVTDRWTYALSELMVIRGDENLALGAEVQMIDTIQLRPVWNDKFLVDGKTPLGPPIQPARSDAELPEFDGVFFQSDNQKDETWLQIDTGKVAPIDLVRLFPVHARQGADYPGYAFPIQFRIEGSSSESFSQPKILYQTKNDFANPGNNPVSIAVQKLPVRFVRIVTEKGSVLGTNKVGYSEVQILRDGENVATETPVTGWHWRIDRPLELIVDGETSYGKIVSLTDWSERWKAARSLRREIRLNKLDIDALQAVAQRRTIGAGVSLFSFGALVFALMGLHQRRRRDQERAEFRMQLAQDLHDEIGSNLAAIARIGEVGEAVESNHESKDDWRSVRELAGECTESMRETLWLLGGPKRDGVSLVEQMRSIALRMLPDIEVNWLTDLSFEKFFPEEPTAREIILVYKAMLANIAHCANASDVKISGRLDGRGFMIQVEDNGDGFDASAWERRMTSKGMGLESMKKRMKRIGGTLEIESEVGGGTCLTITIPA